MTRKILLIEDDIQIQKFIVDYLKDYNFECIAFSLPTQALEELKKVDFELVILDLMLPQMDGFDLFKKIKQIKNIPIIISSARGDIGNKIHGFELGADDYLAKPYEPRELVLRIEYTLKKSSNLQKIKVASFEIDKDNRTVLLDDYPIDLTKIEFEIFLFLVQNLNKITSREQILHATSLDENTKNRTIDMHISNIRYKIGDDSKNPKYIKSVWGIGYKFVG